MANSHLIKLLGFTEKLQAVAKVRGEEDFRQVLQNYHQTARGVLEDLSSQGLAHHGSFTEAEKLLEEMGNVNGFDESIVEDGLMKVHGLNFLVWQLTQAVPATVE